jgi:hypothetical protein
MRPIIDKYVSFAHRKRRAAEKKKKETGDWSKDSIAASRGYLECKTPNVQPKVHRVRKELASCYYQLMMGHAVIAPYLKHKITLLDSDTCWWCKKDIRQTWVHVFKDCIYWKEDIKMFWRKVVKDIRPRCRRYRWKQISELFNEDKATEAILWFLDRTEVGKKPRERPLAEYKGDEPEKIM